MPITLNGSTGLTVSEFGVASIVTEAEGLNSSDNDTSLPTTAAVKDYVDTVGRLTFAAPQATTSGTLFDFAGIPAGVNRVTVIFRGVSLSATDDLLVQLGVSGGPVTTGYFSVGERPASSLTSTSGALIAVGVAAAGFSGAIVFQRVSGNVWVWSYTGAASSTNRPSYGGGDVDLGAALTQVRITRTGASTFDAGTVNVSWE